MLSDEEILMRWWTQEDISEIAHDNWACWAIYWWTCNHCGKTDNSSQEEIFQEELNWIKMDWFNEDNAWDQIDKLKDLYKRFWKELKWKTYWQIWEEATGIIL